MDEESDDGGGDVHETAAASGGGGGLEVLLPEQTDVGGDLPDESLEDLDYLDAEPSDGSLPLDLPDGGLGSDDISVGEMSGGRSSDGHGSDVSAGDGVF